jgi:hypothetical protein
VNKRINISPPLPKFHNGGYIPIDRIVVYFDGKGEEKQIPNGSIYRSYEKLAVTFFIHKSIIQFYSIYHYNAVKNLLELDSTPDSIEYYKIRESFFWPHQGCDVKYYDSKVLKVPEDELNYDFASKNCDWEKPNFEEKLKADGYYDRL